VWHTEEVDKSDLLKELRRDRTPGAAIPRRRGRRIVLALLVLLLLGGAVSPQLLEQIGLIHALSVPYARA